jgi:hypothetical protein
VFGLRQKNGIIIAIGMGISAIGMIFLVSAILLDLSDCAGKFKDLESNY